MGLNASAQHRVADLEALQRTTPPAPSVERSTRPLYGHVLDQELAYVCGLVNRARDGALQREPPQGERVDLTDLDETLRLGAALERHLKQDQMLSGHPQGGRLPGPGNEHRRVVRVERLHNCLLALLVRRGGEDVAEAIVAAGLQHHDVAPQCLINHATPVCGRVGDVDDGNMGEQWAEHEVFSPGASLGRARMGQDGARIEIRACLGRGGFGEVYRATMTRAGGVQAEVAVKVLRKDIDPGSEAVKRLRDEGRLLGALRHPAILHVHDLALLDGRVALITEYVDGHDLDVCIASEPPIPLRALLAVVGEVASALDAAWSTPSSTGKPIQLVHRDIKPSNIRIGKHGEVKLLDFGIARAANVLREAETANDAMMGSFLYMAPERFQDDRPDPASDVYSLGCVLFEGIHRERFFQGASLKTVYATVTRRSRHTAHVEQRLRALDPSVPDDVVVLIRDLLGGDEMIRPAASEAAARLEELEERTLGLTLKRWARGRDWAPARPVVGSLDGRQLVIEPFPVTGAVRRPVRHRPVLAPRRPAPAAAATPDPAPVVSPSPETVLPRPVPQPATVPPSQRRRLPPRSARPRGATGADPRGTRERTTVAATPPPHPSVNRPGYQWIIPDETPDPMGELGDVGAPRGPRGSAERGAARAGGGRSVGWGVAGAGGAWRGPGALP